MLTTSARFVGVEEGRNCANSALPNKKKNFISRLSMIVWVNVEASLCCGEAGRKKKRAREARWEGGRPFPSSLRPPRAFYFFDYCYFDGDTQREPLRRREVSRYIIFKLY